MASLVSGDVSSDAQWSKRRCSSTSLCAHDMHGATHTSAWLMLQGTDAASSKYACDYSNRLCEWTPRYIFGATVMGDKVWQTAWRLRSS